ncbi:hypothetical protein [Pseudomonas monteilii]|uniref:hypothetical protein n=1 Tax=Pseudomonas monteilii TaxID=76759 RepID=UPI001CBF777E|nr:hypothetical protein [Pseudomonas monteilii]MBZ3661949.1 hypothetical protein [Pseudomonas monteilii]MBZ3667275.1 hypothetical protein [Pseudomonas monteilii]
MPVQLTTAAQITEQINMLAQSDSPSEMEIRRVRREIDKVKAADAAQHYMLLGMLCAVVGDGDECRANHDRSLRLSGDTVFLLNYSFSLKRLGATGEALQHLLRAFELTPTERVFAEVAQAMLYSGDLREYDRVLERFIKSNPGVSVDSIHSAKYIKNFRSCLERAGVSLADFRVAMQLVENVLVRAHVRPALEAIKFASASFSGVQHVSIKILMSGRAVEKLVDLNEDIADAMADAVEIEAWNRLVFNVTECTEQDRAADVA